MDLFSPKLSSHCYWILVKMPNSVVAFYDQTHKDRKLTSWGCLGAWGHCWGLQQICLLPASALLAKFNDKMHLFLNLLLVLFCYLQIYIYIYIYIRSERIIKTMALTVCSFTNRQICLLPNPQCSYFHWWEVSVGWKCQKRIWASFYECEEIVNKNKRHLLESKYRDSAEPGSGM